MSSGRSLGLVDVAVSALMTPSRIGLTLVRLLRSPLSTTSATALTTSSSLRFMTRTPVAERPWLEMPPAAVRWTMPPTLMNTSSWCSRTTSAPPSAPFCSVRPIVLTPLAPRLVLRYWSIWVRLP